MATVIARRVNPVPAMVDGDHGEFFDQHMKLTDEDVLRVFPANFRAATSPEEIGATLEEGIRIRCRIFDPDPRAVEELYQEILRLKGFDRIARAWQNARTRIDRRQAGAEPAARGKGRSARR